VGYAGLNWALWQGALKNRFAVTETTSRRTTFDSPFYLPLFEDYAYRGKIQRFSYQGIARLPHKSQLVFGAATERTNLASEIQGYADASGHQSTQGYYVEGLTHITQALTLSAGVRLEDNNIFGTHWSYKASAAYTPDGGRTVLHANYATGFKAPSLYEQFSIYKNPLQHLSPEVAAGWEAGVDENLFSGHVLASLTWFARNTRDLIDFFSCYGVTSPACSLRSNAGGYYYNIGQARVQGLEAGLSGELSHTLRFALNYTYLNAVDGITHTELARRPHDEANATLSWHPAGPWQVGASLDLVGARFDGANDVSPLGGYATADLFVARRLSSHLKLFGRITNLLDHHYEPAAGYGAPGRAVYMGIRWNG
ncbi:MAG: TonB-dependent receptor, partial [Alphaproteobacteria bacterium]|nr:TonB-dependent receptor [Alphaproteobacteria bacterium]